MYFYFFKHGTLAYQLQSAPRMNHPCQQINGQSLSHLPHPESTNSSAKFTHGSKFQHTTTTLFERQNHIIQFKSTLSPRHERLVTQEGDKMNVHYIPFSIAYHIDRSNTNTMKSQGPSEY